MQTSETFSVPRSLQPPIVMRWLCKLASVDVTGADQLGAPGAILLVGESHAALFRAIFARSLSERRGLFIPSGQGDEPRRDYVAYLKNKYDALIAIPADDSESTADARDALHLARAADALIYPIGVSIAPQVTLTGKRHTSLPLPGARIAVVIEAPFKTAEHPEQIPSSWHKAIIALLERANEQARDWGSGIRD